MTITRVIAIVCACMAYARSLRRLRASVGHAQGRRHQERRSLSDQRATPREALASLFLAAHTRVRGVPPTPLSRLSSCTFASARAPSHRALVKLNHESENCGLPFWVASALAKPCIQPQESLQHDIDKIVNVLKLDSPQLLDKEPNWDIFADDFRVLDMTGAKLEGLESNKLLLSLLRRLCKLYFVKSNIDVGFDQFLGPFRELHPDRRPSIYLKWNVTLGGLWSYQVPWLPATIEAHTLFSLNDQNQIESMQIDKWLRGGSQLSQLTKFIQWSQEIIALQQTNWTRSANTTIDIDILWSQQLWFRQKSDEIDKERIEWMRYGR